MAVKSLLILLCALTVNAQQQITYSDSDASTSGVLTLPQFNPALGHLIKADFVATVDAKFWCEATVIDFVSEIDVPLSAISTTDLGSIITDYFQIDMVVNFQTAGPFVYPVVNSYSATVKYRGSDVGQLIGTGDLSFPFATDAHFADEPLVLTVSEIDHCNVSVSITYTYN